MDRILFAQIQKVDEEKRLVYGRAAGEVPDRTKPTPELMDYAASKPLFEKWSNEQHEASLGKSHGNIRAMHQPIAAGHLAEPISFVDDQKAIDICAYISDDQEWQKCLDGTYTGFSVGGRYVPNSKKVDEVGGVKVIRYTAEPNEISLVDRPMIPVATFAVVKADGSVEKREFSQKEAIKMERTLLQELAKADGREAIIEVLSKWAGEEVNDVSTAISALQEIIYLYRKETEEGHPEAAAQITALQEAIKNLKAFIVSEIQEADDGDVINLGELARDLAKINIGEGLDLEKVGKTLNAKNFEKVQSIHDHACAMGAKCAKCSKCSGAVKADTPVDMEKLQKDHEDALAKAASDSKVAAMAAVDTELVQPLMKLLVVNDGESILTKVQALMDELHKVQTDKAEALAKIETLTATAGRMETVIKLQLQLPEGEFDLAKIEAMPAPAKGATRQVSVTVTKNQDSGERSASEEQVKKIAEKIAEAAKTGDMQPAALEMIKAMHGAR